MTPIEAGSFWLPKQSSTLAPGVDRAYDIVLGVSVFFFVLVIAATTLFAIRYRQRQGAVRERQIDHSTWLEIVWTTIPALLLLALFGVGLTGFIDAHVPPDDAMEIKVTGEKWLWTFTYPNGTTTVNEIGVPVNRPVRLLMSSKDVVHSFFVPEFRIKQDLVPGSYTTTWFQATETKEIAILCAEYCGTGHSEMMGKVIVMEDAAFKDWLSKTSGSGLPPEELGKKLYNTRSCAACHSLDGTRIIGPTFKGVFGRTEDIEGGTKVVVDENYIRESILEPQAKIVKGYPPTMPVFRGLLKDNEIDAIIAFLKTVK
jgi:cytochrome c oxidase subunit 2